GLQVIASRTDSLGRFTGAYTRLARLPAPRASPIVLKPFLQRLAGLETRVAVEIRSGQDLTIHADPDQMEQLFINLLRNAAEASLEVASPSVSIGWRRFKNRVDIWVEDAGPGLAN